MSATRQVVVVAAVRDSLGRYLVSLRHRHLLGGDHWEFPGGKLEPGETMPEALSRELREEINIDILDYRYLHRSISQRSSQKSLELNFYEVSRWRGQLRQNDKQAIRWCQPQQIADLKILPASRPLLDCLLCAPLLCLTPEWSERGFAEETPRRILAKLKDLRRSSGERVQLLWRQPSWSSAAQTKALAALIPTCRREQIPVSVARDFQVARATGADWVHCSAEQVKSMLDDSPSEYFGAAAHDEAEVKAAQALAAKYVLISPVKATSSKPNLSPLGWNRFAHLARSFSGISYALGGMSAKHLSIVREYGGYGVAGIGYWWD